MATTLKQFLKLNKTVLKTAVSVLTSDYNTLVNHLDTYVSDIQNMNSNAWSGGKRANKTYEAAQKYYKNSVTAVTNFSQVVAALDAYYQLLVTITNS